MTSLRAVEIQHLPPSIFHRLSAKYSQFSSLMQTKQHMLRFHVAISQPCLLARIHTNALHARYILRSSTHYAPQAKLTPLIPLFRGSTPSRDRPTDRLFPSFTLSVHKLDHRAHPSYHIPPHCNTNPCFRPNGNGLQHAPKPPAAHHPTRPFTLHASPPL